jgi:uncharacterized repeat protein (TIGR01451 family)
VEVQQSVLQWAALGAVGPGSTVVVRDSDINSQLIFADSGGRLEVHDSMVHGSPLAATEDSVVQVSGGLLAASGSVQPCNLHTGLTSSGIPFCNPFVAPGVLPSVTTAGNGEVVIDGNPPAAITDLHLVGGAEPQQVSAGGSFTYRAQVGNAGPDPATGVVVRFRTPDQATVESFSSACTLTGRDVTCSVGNLPLFGASEWLTATYRVASALTPIVGEASVRSDQFDPDRTNHVLRLETAIQ